MVRRASAAKFGLKSFFGAVTERDINSWRSKKARVVQSLGGPRLAKVREIRSAQVGEATVVDAYPMEHRRTRISMFCRAHEGIGLKPILLCARARDR
jgi:hypothetical protein